eukprot:Gregarina_sp_Poly_1__2918@NODE_1816_length_3279_cov_335_659714_g265_i2_p3_GENE_NODE_1816_length_3279_cov_335_659714_g265_i2NODE_1816_length_3279_cov_335_659714_g265_i2_p3_ORF_typecomplete_len142_score21_51WPP/PF13943_6/5_7e03WPP/PF13943_6/0_099PCNP/PF15473_6/1_2e04PCNP/PF15473_6/0_22_NODE_1816_length_3279_cov_335_659714_g265_i223282753
MKPAPALYFFSLKISLCNEIREMQSHAQQEDHLMTEEEATTISKLEAFRHMTVVEFLDYFFDHLVRCTIHAYSATHVLSSTYLRSHRIFCPQCAEARENARRIVVSAFDASDEYDEEDSDQGCRPMMKDAPRDTVVERAGN